MYIYIYIIASLHDEVTFLMTVESEPQGLRLVFRRPVC